jgi:uncharacterized repeat protein (TIGR04076 family)
MATKEYDVVIKLTSNQHPCHSGHKIGDEWVFSYMTPAGMCGFAFNALYPFALAMKIGATFPWQADPDVLTVSCPDVDVHNVFEIRRKLKK